MTRPSAFLWYDLETWGRSPKRDQISQFAAIRTDHDLHPLGDPVNLRCRPSQDYVPDPEACVVTGTTPSMFAADALSGAAFARSLFNVLATPQTCVVGFNNLRFDDEFVRYLLYRHFLPIYDREYKNGNSRWDLLDVCRAARALRPDGFPWPMVDDKPSFKLEALAAAIEYNHQRAHDALADVEATLAIARQLRQAQPRLWEYALSLRDKREVAALLSLEQAEPIVHVSGRFPADRGCLGWIVPVARHPQLANRVIVVDLSSDPEDWLHADADALADRLFTPTVDLPEGISRAPIKSIAINRAPFVAPAKTLTDERAERWGLPSFDQARRWAQRLQSTPDLVDRLNAVFAVNRFTDEVDADQALYDGFINGEDTRTAAQLHQTEPENLKSLGFHDGRLRELLFRYRARYHPSTLDLAESERWLAHCRERLEDPETGVDAKLAMIDAMRPTLAAKQCALLDQLQRDLLTLRV